MVLSILTAVCYGVGRSQGIRGPGGCDDFGHPAWGNYHKSWQIMTWGYPPVGIRRSWLITLLHYYIITLLHITSIITGSGVEFWRLHWNGYLSTWGIESGESESALTRSALVSSGISCWSIASNSGVGPGMQSQPEIRRAVSRDSRTHRNDPKSSKPVDFSRYTVWTPFDSFEIIWLWTCIQSICMLLVFLYLLFSVFLLDSHPWLLARFFLCHQKIAAGSMARFLHLLSRCVRSSVVSLISVAVHMCNSFCSFVLSAPESKFSATSEQRSLSACNVELVD